MSLDYNKYENYVRVGHNGTQGANHTYTCSDLQDFPTPSAIGWALHDVDKDAFTDLQGYTHRNRVRHDVYDIQFDYNVMSDNDLQYILNRISPAWIYIELIDKKTGQPSVHKMYASDKTFDTFRIWKENGEWKEEDIDFSVSFVEE